MVVPPWLDFFNVAKAELILRRPDLFSEVGDVTHVLNAMVAAAADKAVGYAARRCAGLFLGTSFGDELAELGDDRYGLTLQPATKSLTTLTLGRAVANGDAGSVPIGTIAQTVRDARGVTLQFVTTTAASWSSSETGDKSVTAEAVVAGRAGNVALGTITELVSTVWDTITVTNAERAAGGGEIESDEAFKERVRRFPGAQRRATVQAVEYAAKALPGIATATVVEGDGYGDIYVADDSGGSSTALQNKAATELEEWRAMGIMANVVGGTLFSQDIAYRLQVRAGTDVQATDTIVATAITARMDQLAIGETLYLDSLRAAVMATNPRILGVTMITPAGDVTPEIDEVIRAGSITRVTT